MWDDAKRDKAVELYLAAKPTPENTIEVLEQVAAELGESPNGVRMILSKREVYVSKGSTTASTKKPTDTEGKTGSRVNKEEAKRSLVAAITDIGHEVDEEIISKLTGKAMLYFTDVLTTAADVEED